MDKELKLAKVRVTRRKFLKGIGVAAGTLALSGVFRGPVIAQPPPVVPVGTLFDYTGALAEFGPPLRNGADLAAEHINEAAKEVFGGPIIKLIHEDSGTTAAIGVDKAKKLVQVDKVPAIVGSLASGVTIPVATTVTIPNKVLQISPASTSPLISVLPEDVGQDFLFRTTASDAFQGVVAAKLASGEFLPIGKKYKTAATIYVNNPYGQGLSNVFARSFQLRGGVVTAQVPHPEEPKPTYTAELALALKDDPEVLLAISYPGHATVYLKESRDIFKYTSWQFVDGTQSEEIIKAIGAKDLEGKLGTAPGADPEREGFKRLKEAYEKKYGKLPPLPYIDSSYDAVAVIGLAVASAIAGGLPINGVVLRNLLRGVAGLAPAIKAALVKERGKEPTVVKAGVGEFAKALQALLQAKQQKKEWVRVQVQVAGKIITIIIIKDDIVLDYSGAAGEQDFDENGDVVTPQVIWTYTGGTIKILKIIKAEEIPPE
jgi:branched-chain amino acid transport system substrate-binding protein